ncbi:MAG: peptidoglycan-binding protein [Methylococcales bacterium]|nr:peptidoglycan-binding protein [Methylococcales bacterium]
MFNKIISRPTLVAAVLISHSMTASALVDPKAPNDMADALPNAKAGQCFAKVLIPAEYQNYTEKVISREASHKLEIIPAKYHMVEEKIELTPMSEKVIEVPATFKKVEEKILISADHLVWRKGLERKARSAPASWVASAIAGGAVTNAATSGQCFAEYYQAASYKNVEEKIIKREASSKIKVVPAVYQSEAKQVLVKEASEKIIDIPATYDTIKEKILERAAYTKWKKGAGATEKLNNSTGEIMCLVEVPAKYTTITKKILKTAARSERVAIPAEYKTIKIKKLVTAAQQLKTDIPAEYQTITKKVKATDEYIGWRLKDSAGSGKATGKVICRAKIPASYKTIYKQVIATSATTKKIVIPAKSKMMKVKKLLTPAQENKILIPATYAEISKRKKIKDEKLAWRQILCETNTNPEIITKLQQALNNAGFNAGTADGVMGRQTYVAIEKFQKKNSIETGGLTLRTLEALNISFH